MIARAIIASLLLALVPLPGRAQSAGVTTTAPIVNFKLPIYNDAGLRKSLFRGNEARRIGTGQIDIVAMQYTLYKEDGSNEADTTLLAPSASVFLTANKPYKVQGAEGIRIVRDDLDLHGTRWTFETDEQQNRHVTLETNVRVVFRTLQLGNLLK